MIFFALLFGILSFFFYETNFYHGFLVCFGLSSAFFLGWVLDSFFGWKIWSAIKKDLGKIFSAKPKYPKGALDNSFKKSAQKLSEVWLEKTDIKISPHGKHTKKVIEDAQKLFK